MTSALSSLSGLSSAALAGPQVRPEPDAEGIRLVRPDGYLATSAPGGAWDGVFAYLERLAAPAGGDMLA